MRRLFVSGIAVVALAFGAAALFASLKEKPETPFLVAHTTSESPSFEEVIEGFGDLELPGEVGEKEDRLPIVGKSVKTETIFVPVDLIEIDDVVKTTRDAASRKEFQDRWPD